jgi:hypothetical protein
MNRSRLSVCRLARAAVRRAPAVPIALLLALGGAVSLASQQRPQTLLDQARLEVIEDLSESLANDLLDLSVAVRDRDHTRMASYFADSLNADPLPTLPGTTEPKVKWIALRTWSAPAGHTPARLSRESLLKDWEQLLDGLSEIEDVRFKVRAATFDQDAQAVKGATMPTAVPGARGQARIAFWMVGRNPEGQREWLRGTFEATVQYPANGPWHIAGIAKPSLASMVAARDLFSEVAVPAGVARRLPAYGTPQNSGFAWNGAAAADVDGDGWIDLIVTTGNRNVLYLNDGKGGFRDASEETDIGRLASGTAPLLLDYDNDGDQDLFIAAVGAQVLLENRLKPDGRLRFEDVSLEMRVAAHAVGFSAAAADVNADGRPDIYVTSYNHYGRVTPNSWTAASNGTPNLLFVSQRDGTYRERAAEWGVDDPRWSYAAAFADVTGDGRPDLYVANDFGENALFVHHGGRFRDEARERGVLDTGNGMGVAFGDYDNDGRLDLHVTNMSSTAGNRILGRLFPDADPASNVLKKLAAGNNLYRNLGNGFFEDVTQQVGGLSGQWAWGGGFIDVDNDGLEDLYTPNGFISGKSMKDT